MTWGARGSHAIAKGMARGEDLAFQAGVAMAVELVMAHSVMMEACSPVAYVGIRKQFIILG